MIKGKTYFHQSVFYELKSFEEKYRNVQSSLPSKISPLRRLPNKAADVITCN
jgi:hypothetical protein